MRGTTPGAGLPRRALLVCLGSFWLVACSGAAPAPEPSALRAQAQRAAESGRSRFATRHWEASARSFESAAEIYGALDDPASAAAAERNQGEALRRAGRLDDATAAFERALRIDGDGDRPLAQAQGLAGLARCQSTRGETNLAVASAERALQMTAEVEPLRSVLENDLALYLLARGDPDDRERIEALLSSALARSRSDDDARGVAAVQLNRGRAHLRFGESDLAEPPLREALDGFRALDDPEGLARTHEELARLFETRNEPGTARRHLEQARRGYAFLGDEAGLRRLDRWQP
jgi:tetratricopeptide (TPR) repeat protein